MDKGIFVDYLMGELGRRQRAESDIHMASCAQCRLRLETLRRAMNAAAFITPAAVSEGFTDRLMRRIEQERASYAPSGLQEKAFSGFRRLFKPQWGFALTAFAACLIVGAMFFTGNRQTAITHGETLYFSDGPATVNNYFSAPEKPTATNNISGEQKTHIYTDNCATAKCGLL